MQRFFIDKQWQISVDRQTDMMTYRSSYPELKNNGESPAIIGKTAHKLECSDNETPGRP